MECVRLIDFSVSPNSRPESKKEEEVLEGILPRSRPCARVWRVRFPRRRLYHATIFGLLEGLVFQAHRVLYRLTLGSRVMKKKKLEGLCRRACWWNALQERKRGVKLRSSLAEASQGRTRGSCRVTRQVLWNRELTSKTLI
jgi:hypothetical protein